MSAVEANFDGLVGPTHNYAGLSYGNKASVLHGSRASNPLEACLQGLKKMRQLTDAGFLQGVLAPQERPSIKDLKELGFTGSDRAVLEQAAKEVPHLLAACSSASSMWTANAATVSPSADTGDGRIHITPANLNNKYHRAIEPETTGRILRASFPAADTFVHHKPLPSVAQFGDEGAANHTRFCREYGESGVEFFVFGRYAWGSERAAPKVFPARQTFEASQAVARRHGVKSAVFAQQNPAAIDAGVFHNDVCAVGNRDLLFCHEQAYLDQEQTFGRLREAFPTLKVVEVPSAAVSLSDAVQSYLFNTQLLSYPDGTMGLVAPEECRETASVHAYLEALISQAETPIRKVTYLDLRQSMRNGGGPACLRLRVVLTENEQKGCNPGVLFNALLHGQLAQWAKKHYRDRLEPSGLADPQLLEESRTALDELTQILKLGSVYPFQLSS